MAIPDTLQAWRDYVADEPTEPPRLTPTELAALSPTEKAQYDDDRVAFLDGNIILSTPDTDSIDLNARLLVGSLASKKFTARPDLPCPASPRSASPPPPCGSRRSMSNGCGKGPDATRTRRSRPWSTSPHLRAPPPRA